MFVLHVSYVLFRKVFIRMAQNYGILSLAVTEQARLPLVSSHTF